MNDLNILARELLNKAISLYGAISSEYAFGGVIIRGEKVPRIFFDEKRENVFVSLTQGIQGDDKRTIFQLAHEVVHLLSPRIVPKTSNLEEGLACHFSNLMVGEYTGDVHYATWGLVNTAYYDPFIMVRDLLTEFPECIKELRTKQPYIGLINFDTLKNANLNLTKNQVDFLVSTMNY